MDFDTLDQKLLIIYILIKLFDAEQCVLHGTLPDLNIRNTTNPITPDKILVLGIDFLIDYCQG